MFAHHSLRCVSINAPRIESLGGEEINQLLGIERPPLITTTLTLTRYDHLSFLPFGRSGQGLPIQLLLSPLLDDFVNCLSPLGSRSLTKDLSPKAFIIAVNTLFGARGLTPHNSHMGENRASWLMLRRRTGNEVLIAFGGASLSIREIVNDSVYVE